MKKRKEKSIGNSLFKSDFDSSFDSSGDASSIDTLMESSLVENEERASKIRENIKGAPIIGRLKRGQQYAITIVLSICAFTFANYTGYTAYSQYEKAKNIKVASSSIGGLIDVAKKDTRNYAYLNSQDFNKLSSAKNEIEKNIGVLRANEYINSGAISSIDSYWKTLSQKINTIENSKEKLTHNETLINSSINGLEKDIITLNELVKLATSRSDMNAYKTLYLAQILSDVQSLNMNLVELKGDSSNYEKAIQNISQYNPIVTKKIDALVSSIVPEDIKKSLLTIKEDLSMSNNNINTVINRLQPVVLSMDKLKEPVGNIELSIGQIKSSLNNFETKEVVYYAIISLLMYLISIFFFMSIIYVNFKEASKDLIVSEEIRKTLESAILRIVNDITMISEGDYNRKVKNTTESLMSLKDAINKLVETFVDKFENIYQLSTGLKNDSVNYEKLHSHFIERANNQSRYKTELKDNNKLNINIMVGLKTKNHEVLTKINSLQPEFNIANESLSLFIETTKEIDKKKLNNKSRTLKLEENLNRFKTSLDTLVRLCDYMETLSLSSEIISKKTNGNNNSFKHIAEDFNKKADDIRLECQKIKMFMEDSSINLFNLGKNNEDIERYSHDLEQYFSTIKKVFPTISTLLNTLKGSQKGFIQDNKQINELKDSNENLLSLMEDSLKNNDNSLLEMKELNKSSKIRSTDIQQNVKFIEQISRDQ